MGQNIAIIVYVIMFSLLNIVKCVIKEVKNVLKVFLTVVAFCIQYLIYVVSVL